jgi:hypothetical protein
MFPIKIKVNKHTTSPLKQLPIQDIIIIINPYKEL